MPPVELVLMAGAPAAVLADRCLWQRHQAAACSYCQDACPAGAIEFAGRTVQVNPDRCLGCGACLATCPVQCFETAAWSERSLLSTLARLGGPAVEIACRCHPAPQAGSLPAGGADAPVLQVGVCLAALSPGIWFEMGLEHAVGARLEYCADCPLAHLADYTRRAIDLANAWLQACGRPPRVAVQTAEPAPEQAPGPISGQARGAGAAKGGKAPKARLVVSAERPILNRRDFLFGFARSSGPPAAALACLPAAAAGTADGSAADGGAADGRLPPYQPAWLRRLAALYPSVAASPAASPAASSAGLGRGDCGDCGEAEAGGCAHWPAMQVTAGCTACGACARYCPSGALATVIAGGVFEHHFMAGVCVACGLCAQVCAPGALLRGYAPDPTPFAARVVAQQPISACRKCGGAAPPALGGLCYWCANEPSMRSVVEGARGLFRVRG
jgi:ferredoxin